MIKLPAHPFMNEPEVRAIEALIRERKPARTLEWGSGGSTLYYPLINPEGEWVSIEHDPVYAHALDGRLPSNVTLMLLPFPEYHRPKLEQKFDLIIVDGRMRVRCLDAARKLLAEGGVVILHDAGRARYGPALKFYEKASMLVPAMLSKDPRGLRIFSDPVPDGPLDLPPIIADRGVMYACWGPAAIREAEASIASLMEFDPGMPVIVVGDAETVDHFSSNRSIPVLLTIQMKVDPFVGQTTTAFNAGMVKPLLAGLSPFEKTLYVDADTVFKRSPAIGFDLLDHWDFVIAEADTRSLAQTFSDNRAEANATAKWLGTPHILYHNSGLFFWRRSPAAVRLFELWSEEWEWFRGWDEQIALLRALLNSDALFLSVPYTWNCYNEGEAFLIHHRFGSRTARKYRQPVRNTPALGGRNGSGVAQPRPLVRFEVAPGRFVRIHDGDQESVREHYVKTRLGARIK